MEEFNKKLLCANCKSVKKTKFCDNCQQETPNFIKLEIRAIIKTQTSLGIKQKRPGFKRFVKEIFSGYKSSGDKKLSKGVSIEQTIDRENNKYDQVVKDNQTGEIIHEEHEPLSDHNKHKS
ncbi:MAG TPA: hypothetical protein PKG74_00235 [Candidatus Colwellbacteria bacterium]|nr:hypothetical protein [Candidatus Colwellbacteria bacterium]